MEPATERGFILISCPQKERCCHRANIAHIKLKHRCVLVREYKKESRWGGGGILAVYCVQFVNRLTK